MNIKKYMVLASVAAITICCLSVADEPVRSLPTVEPPMHFMLHLGDAEVEITANQSFNIDINGHTLSGMLEVNPMRRLETPEIVFEYPVDFGFELLTGRSVQVWNLDGGRTDITVSRFVTDATPEQLGEHMYQSTKSQIADRIKDEADVTIELDGRTIKGRRLVFVLNGIAQAQESFAFRVDKAVYQVVFLGSPPPGQSIETVNMSTMDLFKKSFRFQ